MTETLLSYSKSLALNGPDTVALLERLVTCRVDDMVSGNQRPGALLTPQGKVIADFLLTRTDTGCLLSVHENAIADLEKRLKLFRLRADVEITRHEEQTQAIDHEHRITCGLSAYEADFVASEIFPTDINLDRRGGIDYKKGCFVGQEVVSRMKRRGKIRKRTVVLKGNHLEKGQTVHAGKTRLGAITSATDKVALAILRIDHLATAIAEDIQLLSAESPVSPVLSDWLKTEMEALRNANS